MKSLKVLDVTLRDGGCVIDFNFGQTYMDEILTAQEASGVDFIEVGYIDENNGSEIGRTQYLNDRVISENFLKHKKNGVTYVAMIDYGKFNIDNLRDKTDKSIDGIRMAFHKEDCLNIIQIGKKIIEKGYEFYVQPMITMRYSDVELLELINIINIELPNASGFYIVDSFGEMRPNDMKRVLNLIDHNLLPDMTIGFHSHNNLQMSYSNAVELLQFPTNRNVMIDSSIMGMGKGAGNLNTELLLEHLNLYYGKSYDISPLLEVIDKVINQLHTEYYWGYAVEYYLSAIKHCTPSYASHFYNKHMLPIAQVAELLGMISDDKKISFDKVYAEKLYFQYNASMSVDDSKIVQDLKLEIADKTVLLIAPGKSNIRFQDEIIKLIKSPNIISISINHNQMFSANYVLITKTEAYHDAIKGGENVIVTSNVSKGGRGNVRVVNYKRLINIEEYTHDSAGVIILNLLKECEASRVLLAGFDGFSDNINENYINDEMRRPITAQQANERNAYFKKCIKKMEKYYEIEFVTPSVYENQ